MRRASVDLAPDVPLDRAVRVWCAGQWIRWERLVPRVLAGADVEAIHDLRVAARRLRAALQMLEPYAGQPVRRLRPTAREIGRALGRVRDLDVLLENLGRYIQTSPGAGLGGLQADWTRRRREARDSLLELFDSKRAASWSRRMARFVEGEAETPYPRLCDTAPGLVWERYGRLRAYEPRAAEAPPAELHLLRMEARRLRYALEFLAGMLGSSADDLIRSLISLQDALGELHDAEVARQLAHEFFAASGAGAARSVPAAYDASLLERMSVRRAAFLEQWALILQPAYRQSLAQALAQW